VSWRIAPADLLFSDSEEVTTYVGVACVVIIPLLRVLQVLAFVILGGCGGVVRILGSGGKVTTCLSVAHVIIIPLRACVAYRPMFVGVPRWPAWKRASVLMEAHGRVSGSTSSAVSCG